MQPGTLASLERVYVNGINPENLSQTIRDGLQFVEFQKYIDTGSTVFIKPNLTDSTHKPGITTTPLMIKTVVEVISPLVRRVFVGESDGGNYSYSADTSLRNHGVYDVASSFSNVEVVNLSQLRRTRVHDQVCGTPVWVELPNLLLRDVDCLVSVPVFKTHAMTLGTFSIKNLWGCYPDPMRLLYHKNLDYKLALINKLVRNRLQIIDGFWSLDGHGPMEGTPVATNKVLIANNPVAADAAAAYLMHLDARKIGHIRAAEQYGLGSANFDDITFNKPIRQEQFSRFMPYKVKMDYFSVLLFRSEALSKVVLDSPITPLVYKTINRFRPEHKHTYWAERNKASYNQKS